MLSEESRAQSWMEEARRLEDVVAARGFLRALMADSRAWGEIVVEGDDGLAFMTISSLGRKEMSYTKPGVESR